MTCHLFVYLNEKWAMHLFWKQDAFTCGGNQKMKFDFEQWFCFSFGKRKVLYIPSFFRNLVSISRLLPFGFFFNISNKFHNIYCKYDLIGNDTPFDGLFCLSLQNNISYTSMHVHASIKRCVINEKFPYFMATEIVSYHQRKN